MTRKGLELKIYQETQTDENSRGKGWAEPGVSPVPSQVQNSTHKPSPPKAACVG